MKIILVLSALSSLVACSTMPVQPLAVSTPSGRPEAIFLTSESAEAANKIASGCMTAGMTVVSSSDYQVVCESNLSMTQQVLTQTLIGNSYSTTPSQFVQFNLADLGETVRVQANSWVQTQMAFGQIKKMPTDQSNKQKNDLQGALFGMGGVPVPGSVDATAVPRIGVQLLELSSTGNSPGSGGVFIGTVNPGGPAEQAGLNSCDHILSISGTPIENIANYSAEVARLPEGSSLDLVVARDGSEFAVNITPTTDALKLETAMFEALKKLQLQGCASNKGADLETAEVQVE